MRLLTRSDFDGLACGALLKEAGVVDGFKFVHPKDIQDGLVTATADDALANIPYIPGCGLWFDHHVSEYARVGVVDCPGDRRITDSCSRIVYDYYGGAERFPHLVEMIDYVDRVDAAKLTADEIKNPTGWILLGFVMDPRTGLGRFRSFRVSNYELMEMLLDECRSKSIDEILDMPDVRERIDMYNEQNALFTEMLEKYSTVYGNCIVTDLRGVDTIYTGNRFLLYSLFPEQNISVWVVDGRDKRNCPIAVGHSILNRTSNTKVGDLCLKYGGGGHDKVGTCQVDYGNADEAIRDIVAKINADG
jgi:nanoRNase/pAp phosphatase (c-di-AMP/oligoRNAs hydrolase)